MGKGGGEPKMSHEQSGVMRQQKDQKDIIFDYLQQIEQLPSEAREGAIQGLMDNFLGGQKGQQATIDKAIQSPLYGAIMGGREAGEEGIMRNASMTGGLRSGNVQENLYDYNVQLENQALLQSYGQNLQGLQGLAQTPGYSGQMVGLTGGVPSSNFSQGGGGQGGGFNLGGALSGGAAGAKAGSAIMPGWGTAIGGGLGAVMGGFG